MKSKLKVNLLLATLFTLPLSCFSDEATIKKVAETKLGSKVDSVSKSGFLNLYEIYTDGQIFYTDEKASVFIGGPLIESKSGRNITQERLNRLSAIKWGDLPLERAIKQVRGDGKRLIASFEDPNCGYCKRLAKELLKLDNVTLYTFLYPILSPDSEQKSRQIWCSTDRAKTWNEWMTENKTLLGKTDCDTSIIGKNQEYGHRLKITGTPTLFFADGERIVGAVPLNKIEEKLNSLKQ